MVSLLISKAYGLLQIEFYKLPKIQAKAVLDLGHPMMTCNQDWFRTIKAKTFAAERKAVYDEEDFKAYFCDFRYAITEFAIF